jgi:dienelactone hydrolase
MVPDARAALEWLLKRPTIDKSHVGVQGFSLGSTVAATLAGTCEAPPLFDGAPRAFSTRLLKVVPHSEL